MKPVFTISILLALTIHLVDPLLVSGWFYARQSALAKEHCENLVRPELNCDGQCFLVQKLEAYYASKHQTTPQADPIPTFLPLGYQISATEMTAMELVQISWAEELSLVWPSPRESRIFHPPRQVEG